MHSPFYDWKDEIKEYCDANSLDFSKVNAAPKGWRKDILIVQHFDDRAEKHGLKDETPAPVTLIVRKIGDALTFEQTEFTKRYLT